MSIRRPAGCRAIQLGWRMEIPWKKQTPEYSQNCGEERVTYHSYQPCLCCSTGSPELRVFTAFVSALSVPFALVSDTVAFSFASTSELWVGSVRVRNCLSAPARRGSSPKKRSSPAGMVVCEHPDLGPDNDFV